MKTTKTGRRTLKRMRSRGYRKSHSGTNKKRSFWSKLFRWLFGSSSKAKRHSSKHSARKRIHLRAKKVKRASSYRRNKRMAA